MQMQPPNPTSRLASGIDKLSYGFAKHWLLIFNTAVAIYVLLPIAAPTLMKMGLTAPARVIYTIYSPMCHQMATRSFFLYGDQPVYPRELAGTNFTSLESYAQELPEFAGINPDNWAPFFLAARSFLGNEQMGYKTALCQRDMAIYGFIFLGGVLYAIVRRFREIKPLPVIVFIIVGMGPIALDGFSQLFSYAFAPTPLSEPAPWQLTLQNLLPLRESPPAMRFLTGAIFGFMLVWLVYPHINKGMKATEQDMAWRLSQQGSSPPPVETISDNFPQSW
jgi:uncharacterized membrane protein